MTITKRDPRFRGGEGGFFPLSAGQAEQPAPELTDIATAAFFQENSLGAVLNGLRYNLMIRDNEVDPTFDAFAAAKNTALADFPETLARVKNRNQFQVALAQLVAERKQDEILQAGGGVGIAAAVASGVLDPINFAIPIPAAFASRGLLRAAANTSVAAAGAAGLQESILKSQQFERSALEVGLNVGGAALVGGIFGAMVGAGSRGRVNTNGLADLSRSIEDAHVGLRVDDLPEDLALREEAIATRLLDRVDLSEIDPAIRREATASLQENASEIAKGNVSPTEALEHFREDFPKRILSETGVAAQTAAQLETAMRISRAKVEPSFDVKLKTNAGETAKITMSAPQPPDALVGYHTRADDLVDPVEGLHREDGTFTFQLDTPLDLKSQDGFVNGVRVEIPTEQRFRLFDPEALVDGTAKLSADEADRLLQAFRARGPAGLMEEGYIGLVRHVEEGNFAGREVAIWAIPSRDELVSPKIEVTSSAPVRFSSLNTDAPVSERLGLELKLGMNRGLLQGGSPLRTAGVYADGRMIIPDVDRFEAANNPFGAFRTLNNKQRTDGRINVNNATVRELTSVRGVGPTTATRIHNYISAGNDIRGLDELVANGVITEAKANQIAPFIDFEDFQPLGPITTRIKSVPFVTRAMTPMFPFLRVATSLSESVRNMSLRLFDNAGLAYESDVLYRQPISVETLIKRHFVKLIGGERALNDNYLRYRDRVAGRETSPDTASRFDQSNVGKVLVRRVKDVVQRTQQAGGPLTFREFNERVGMALRFGDSDNLQHASALGWRLVDEEIPEVSRAARAIRHEFFEPFRDELITAGLISSREMSELGDLAPSYFTRVYNVAKMKADPDGFMRMASDHFVSERGMLEPDARIAARDVFDNITGAHEGRTLYRPEDWQFRKSSKLRDRWLRIPEDKLAPWLEHDADLVMRLYHRTVAPDIELSRFISSFSRERKRLARLRHVGEKRKFDLLEQDEAQLLREMEPLQTRIDNPDTDPNLVKALVQQRTELQSNLNEILAELGEDPLPTGELLSMLRNDPPVPDIVNFKDVRDAISEDYTRLLRQVEDPKEKAQLQSRRERDLRDMTEMMHLLRGTNRGDWDKSFVPVRIMRGMRRFNVLTMGGGFMLSSIPDVARLVMVNGAQNLYGDLAAPLIRSLRDPELAAAMQGLKSELRDMGVAYEVILNNRASIMSELADDFGAMNRIEKGLETASDTMFLINMMSPWNDTMKTFAGITSTLKILRSARAVSEGGEVAAETMESLRRLGLGEPELKAIWRMHNRHGVDELWDGLKTPNHHRWEDDLARDSYENAIRKEVDNIIVTPGVGDRPLLMNREVFKTLLQFKSFAFASTLRITHGALQARDAWVLQQMALSMALGMMVYQTKSWQYGRNTSGDVRDWFMEGLNRSGLPGIVSEVDALVTYSTSGNLGMAPLIGAKTPNAFMARRSLQGTLLGPSFQRIETIQTLMTDLANGDFRRRDVSRMRDLMAFQNVWYLSWLYDTAEEGGKRLAN